MRRGGYNNSLSLDYCMSSVCLLGVLCTYLCLDACLKRLVGLKELSSVLQYYDAGWLHAGEWDGWMEDGAQRGSIGGIDAPVQQLLSVRYLQLTTPVRTTVYYIRDGSRRSI